MPDKGWICIHRKIRDSWIWDDKPYDRAHAWIDLLLSANHEDKKIVLGNDFIEVKRGSFITSLRKLSERWGWSNTKIKSFLDTLQSDGMAIYKSDTHKTVINIVNYSVYQDIDDTKNITETSQKHHENDTETPQKHTNNNDNNINNIYMRVLTPAEKPMEGGAQNKDSGKGYYTQEFELFWAVYPRKIEKKKAFGSWNARLKEKIQPDAMIRAAENYAQICKGAEEKFIKYPPTFLGRDKPYEEYISMTQNEEVKKPWWSECSS
jgi:hypothetical protein